MNDILRDLIEATNEQIKVQNQINEHLAAINKLRENPAVHLKVNCFGGIQVVTHGIWCECADCRNAQEDEIQGSVA